MPDAEDIARRKADHVALVLRGAGIAAGSTGLERVTFEHVAAPELDLEEVSTETTFLGRRLKAPVLISSMTGGFEAGADINYRCAQAAQSLGVAFAVGSQRIALERGADIGLNQRLREIAPDIPIYANIGAAQIVGSNGLDYLRRAIDMISADAVIIHFNPLQEAVQRGGDADWSGVLGALERVVRGLDKPVMVKEVGFGISAKMAKRFLACGVAAIDVAGAGGTNWALVEGQRSPDPAEQAVAAAFAGWGIPTADAITAVRAACPGTPLIASGGLRTGVDAAKSIRLGADLAGFAAGILPAASRSVSEVEQVLSIFIRQLRICMFCTGSRTLDDLRTARLLPARGPLADH
jgi:isopentenyl-diphosphate delta-isomerase